MANDSSTGGPLLPISTPTQTDAELEAILQGLIKNITGLPGNLVRPRWQAVAPKQPEVSVNWASIGVSQITPLGYSPSVVHHADGSDTLTRHERIECLATFYGPAGQQYAELCRDGFWIRQNTEPLAAYDMAFVDASQIRAIPELVNQQWVRRYDLTLLFNRKVTRDYAVLSLVFGEIVLEIDEPRLTETIEVSN